MKLSVTVAALGALAFTLSACGTPGGGGGGGFPLPDVVPDQTTSDADKSPDEGDPDTGPEEDGTTPGDCVDAQTRCSGNTVEICVGGVWTATSPCPGGSTCQGGGCVPDGCVPDCFDRECGSNGCGGSCGTCLGGESCIDGVCEAQVCVGSCAGKQCGDDGCGNACGQCTGGTSCVAGQCQSTCAPSCAGKECGDDGCGGSCGTCSGGGNCFAGQCQSTCVPSCSGKECGSDGCGGTCGTCPGGWACSGGTCQQTCTPSCAGKQCGSDGCGGTCGTCAGGTSCSASGQCVGGSGASCDVVFECMQECETEACADSCAAQASNTGLTEYSNLMSCLQTFACPDILCVADNCASPWAACFSEGTGSLTCEGIWSCQNECGTNDSCPQACIESGTMTAQGHFTAVLLCVNAYCGGSTDPECVPDVLSFECSSYVSTCLQ